ncbi:MAG: hypothetical protein WCY05_06515, partial [Candidatus Omnitrophota bacterium]
MKGKMRLSIKFSYLIAAIFLSLQIFVFAQTPEDKSTYQQTPKIKGYTQNLKRLIEQAEENLKKVNKEIKDEEVRQRNQERETKVREHFEKGNQLYEEGKLKEAKVEWEKAIEISKDPDMIEYIKEAGRKVTQEELILAQQEKEQKQKLELEQKEKARLEKEQAQAAEAARKEELRKQKEA